MPSNRSLTAIGKEAARRLSRQTPFSATYVHRVLRGERGNLDGRNARMIRQIARKRRPLDFAEKAT